MAHESIAWPDLVRMLANGTKNGKIKWDLEEGEDDVFRANFGSGAVRLSHVVDFSGVGGASGSILLELLDPSGRSIFQFRPQMSLGPGPLGELFNLARNQALDLEKVINALIEEIKTRSETQ